MTQWARENAASSGLADRPIRWIVDDCKKFVQRELRRGRKYDAIIMDPPSYGRGPSGETWKIEEDVADFIDLTMGLLSDDPLFVLVSSYSTGLAPSVMSYLLGITVGKQHQGYIESQELGLPVTSTGLVLPCGSSARFIGKKK
jgi:23S rRNA (cytosine1962-C5)-methyltransferase